MTQYLNQNAKVGLLDRLHAAASAQAPSMGDPDFVESQLRVMATQLAEIRGVYHQGKVDAHITAANASTDLITTFTANLCADNAAYGQVISTHGQRMWLCAHGYQDVGGVVAECAHRTVTALELFEDEKIDADIFRFHIDAAIEDAQNLIMCIDAREPYTEVA